MYRWHAKKLKKGDRVFWKGTGKQISGTVSRKYYNTIWIDWDEPAQDLRTKWFAESMEHIFTQEQLDNIAQEKRMVEAFKKGVV